VVVLGLGDTPVPVNVTCGALLALLANAIVAEREPATVGVNVVDRSQLAPVAALGRSHRRPSERSLRSLPRARLREIR